MWALYSITALKKFPENVILSFEKMSVCVIDLYVLILVLLLYFVYIWFAICTNVQLVKID